MTHGKRKFMIIKSPGIAIRPRFKSSMQSSRSLCTVCKIARSVHLSKSLCIQCNLTIEPKSSSKGENFHLLVFGPVDHLGSSYNVTFTIIITKFPIPSTSCLNLHRAPHKTKGVFCVTVLPASF